MFNFGLTVALMATSLIISVKVYEYIQSHKSIKN